MSNMLIESSIPAIELTTSVGNYDWEELLFNDKLVVINQDGSKVGEFTINVEGSEYNEEKCILVKAVNKFTLEGNLCGSELQCYMDRNLFTYKQETHDFMKIPGHKYERLMTINNVNNEYEVNVRKSIGSDFKKVSKKIPIEKGVLSEGAALVLQRVIAAQNLTEPLTFITIDDSAQYSLLSFQSLGKDEMIIDDESVETHGIEMINRTSTESITSWQSYYMSDGHLARRMQVGAQQFMVLQYVPDLVNVKDEKWSKPKFVKEELNWKEDLQLCSHFAKRKEELKASHTTYLKNHPEVHEMLADFSQLLLLKKPQNIISFAAEHFGSYSKDLSMKNIDIEENPFVRSENQLTAATEETQKG